jgi:hypothetical protein
MEQETLDASTDEPITMSDLEADTEVVTPEPDSSTAPVEKQEEKNADPFQERINKVTAQKYEQQRRADGLEAELQKARANVVQPIVPSGTPTPPDMPEDVYDSEAMQNYHTNMVAYNQTVADNAATSAYEKQNQLAQEQTQQAAQQQTVSTFVENAIRDGIDTDKLRVAEQTLVQAGITPQLGEYLMKDKHGGKVAEYLHDNPAVMHEMLALDPVTAAVRIETEIKTKALSQTPKVSNAPEPIPEISGSGAINKDDFERSNPGTVFI